MSRLADYLDLIRPYVPGALVSREAHSEIRRVAAYFPGILAFGTFGFECPLGTAAPTADFLFSLSSENSGPEVLSGSLADCELSSALFSYPQWRRLRHFGRRWADPTGGLHAEVDDVWLEFDVARNRETDPIASMFFSPFKQLDAERKEGLTAQTLVDRVQTVYVCTTGRVFRSGMLRQWWTCMENLPRVSALFQVGNMIARDEERGIRMCVKTRSVQEVMRYLAAVRWPGDVAEVRRVLSDIQPLVDSFALHLDVGEEISPKIGIECGYHGRRGPEREPRWHGFLEFLDTMHLCLPEKADGLLAFPGYAPTDGEACPAPLRKVAHRLSLLWRSFFVRSIYHIKLTHGLEGRWEAKAYLGVRHLWKGPHRAEFGHGPWGLIR